MRRRPVRETAGVLHAPYRGLLGADGRPAGAPLPPDPLPLVVGRRVRKRWRYVGAFGPELSVCVGLVRIGPLTQSFWAVWDRADGRLHERTRPRAAGVRHDPGRVVVNDGPVRIDLHVDEGAGDAVETATPYGPGYAWTVKRAGVPVRGTVAVGGHEHAFDGLGVVDDSAGYPPRHTSWRWSAGVGSDTAGRVVGWNLVDGIHDDPAASERSVWVDGRAVHAPPVRFADDLSTVAALDGTLDLRFAAEATRRRDERLLVVRSSYEQPFGTFAGTLAAGVQLAHGSGVMERHDAVW